MKKIISAIILIVFASCSELFLGEDVKSTPRQNFEQLWTILDQKYSFFEYKNIDWNDVHERYSSKITNNMSDVELFNVLFSMLSELKDAHVNLVSPFNVSRYDAVFYKGPENYDSRLVLDKYLRSNFFVTGPLKHTTIGYGRIGYVRYESFSSTISSSDIDFVINKYKDLKGIIIDVRSNGGGYVSNVFTLCKALADKRRHVYTSYIKTGPEHEDFSEPNYVYIDPASKSPFDKPIIILTNRSCYSATSFFVLAMKAFPNVLTVGDTTGGGLGAPTGAELPNGWSFRFSCSRTLSPEGRNFEDGIPPDKVRYLKEDDVNKGFDTIIEYAVYKIINWGR